MDKIYAVNKNDSYLNFPKNNRSNQESYKVLAFISELKQELHNITNLNITDKVLSGTLGFDERHITYIKKNFKRNPRFQISLQELEIYSINLHKKFQKKSLPLKEIVEKYINFNNPKKEKNKIYDFHPKFNLHYFSAINTKEKAYWLGFLFADGSISYKRGGRKMKSKNLRLRFGLNAKDRDSINRVNLLAKTLGIEPKYVGIKSNGLYGFEVTCDNLVNDLIKHGLLVGKNKTYQIEIPSLDKRELVLAFLLGYFDGDGKQGTSRITSSSYKFINQIKIKFNLPYHIYREPGKTACSLHLGAELFNELLDNYKDSMARKRVWLVTPEELIKRNTKLKIRAELLINIQKFVLYIPINQLSDYFGISSSRLGQICEKTALFKPNKGYWLKNKRVGISPILLEKI